MPEAKFEREEDLVMVEILGHQFSYHGRANVKRLLDILPEGKWKGVRLQPIAQEIFDVYCKV